MMKKFFACALFALVSAATLSAEIVTKNLKLEKFDRVYVGNALNVTMKSGSTFAVDYTLDSKLVDFCSIYVRDGILYFTMDERSFPPELKAQLRNKETRRDVSITVFVPANVALKEININNNVQFKTEGKIVSMTDLTLCINGNAVMKDAEFKADRILVDACNKSSAFVSLHAGNVTLKTVNNAKITPTVSSADTVKVFTDGPSVVNCLGKCNVLEVASAGPSLVNVKCEAKKFNVDTKILSKVNASEASLKHANVKMSAGECQLGCVETLVMDMSSGAKLLFDGNPVITIEKINGSSVLKQPCANASKAGARGE